MTDHHLRVIVASSLLVAVCASFAAVRAFSDTLTETEQLHRNIAILQSRLHRAIDERDEARAQLAPLQHQVDEYRVEQAKTKHVLEVEAAHPCCTYDLETGSLTPKPPVAPTQAPKP